MGSLKRVIRDTIGWISRVTRLQLWPVRVRAGMAKGALWTVFPFSANWRCGGEENVQRAFSLLHDPAGAVCWDLGAHFGIHTVGLARQVGTNGSVFAFEPAPVAFARLDLHVRMNRLENVKLYNVAASNADGELNLIVAGGLGSTVTHAKYKDEVLAQGAELLRSKCARLDTLVDAAEVSLPAFVKIDVEGHRAKALSGASSSIARSLPVIVLSVHSREEWQDSWSVLQPLGYTTMGLNHGDIDVAPIGKTLILSAGENIN